MRKKAEKLFQPAPTSFFFVLSYSPEEGHRDSYITAHTQTHTPCQDLENTFNFQFHIGTLSVFVWIVVQLQKQNKKQHFFSQLCCTTCTLEERSRQRQKQELPNGNLHVNFR
uniref:(northern house mosquito) hypothetical protein n=1 Tax=Culex pipiens TaxID=7175 RepID=A0A8D8A602_CULPI